MLHFELITPEGIKFDLAVYEVILPTSNGQISVLPGHQPVVSLASAGVISIRHQASHPDSALDHVATSGGILSIDGQSVRLLADTAERAEDIDELRAQEALEHARELQKTAADHVAVADATRLIERNLVRLKVAEIRRRHRPSPDEGLPDIHTH